DFEAELTRDPREQGFMDAKAGNRSEPHPWYSPTERGQYAEGYIAGGQGRKGRSTPPARLKPRENPIPNSVRKLARRHRCIARSDFEAELTRDPREQGFMDAKAGNRSEPHPWYSPTERGQYAEGYIAGGQGRKGRSTPPARLKPRENPIPNSVRKLARRHRCIARS